MQAGECPDVKTSTAELETQLSNQGFVAIAALMR